jgi:hypothetical protein
VCIAAYFRVDRDHNQQEARLGSARREESSPSATPPFGRYRLVHTSIAFLGATITIGFDVVVESRGDTRSFGAGPKEVAMKESFWTLTEVIY